jgi:cytochrome b6-f complex iron-sulfur subunit
MAGGVGPNPGGVEADRPLTRRNFIVWYLAGLLTATGVAVVAPLLVFLFPPAGSSKQQRVTVKLDRSLGDVAEGEALKFESPAQTGFVMADGGGDNRPGAIAFSGYVVRAAGALDVFAANCSHLGCTIEFQGGAARFACPCHGSQFSPSGQVLHGPAAYPLSHLSWAPGGNPDEILVTGLSLPGVA